jgi:hypothetical protein
MEALCTELRHSNDKPTEKKELYSLPVTVLQRHHKHVQKKPYGRCEWGKLYPPGCPRKRSANKRKVGTDITEQTVNGINETILGGSKTHFECSKCQIWLCGQGGCWQRYYHSIGVNF